MRRAVLHDLDLDTAAAVAVPPQHVDIDPEVAPRARPGGHRVQAPQLPLRTRPPLPDLDQDGAAHHPGGVVVGGWTPGRGRRTGTVGALLLGAHDHDGALRYLGSVGTGFTAAALNHLHRTLAPLAQNRSPFDEPIPAAEARAAHWVRPVLVGEVVYHTLTHDRRLRHAAWRGLRVDRTPDDAVLA
ncbi:MAG: hypothetical protein L0H64_10995 [Pseudonocardia sp.]|nr:hypothetical protein [Pseudonocardia sp.]